MTTRRFTSPLKEQLARFPPSEEKPADDEERSA